MGLASITVNSTVTAQFNELQLQVEEKLEAKFAASVTSGEAPLTVTFDASASTGKGELTYNWRRCTGEAGESKIMEYTFTEVGDIGCTLLVTDSTGEQDSFYMVIHVSGGEPAVELQLPYTMDADIAARAYSALGRSSALLESADTIPVANYNNGKKTVITVFDSDINIIATDVVIPDIKENIHFSPKNTALAEMLTDWDIAEWPKEHKAQLYLRFDQHPRFQEAVDVAASIEVFTGSEDFYLLTNEIVKDTARAYAIEQGWVDPINKVILPHPGYPGNGSQNP